jgi:hypothetical protein
MCDQETPKREAKGPSWAPVNKNNKIIINLTLLRPVFGVAFMLFAFLYASQCEDLTDEL